MISAWFSGSPIDNASSTASVNLVGWIAQEAQLLRSAGCQTGLVQNYALLMLFGVFAFVSVYLFAAVTATDALL